MATSKENLIIHYIGSVFGRKKKDITFNIDNIMQQL